MNYTTPIRDRLAFKGESLSTIEVIIYDKKCNVTTYEPYLSNDGDGAVVAIFDFGTPIHRNQYFAIEKSIHYKYFLIGFTLLNDGGSETRNISSLPNDDLNVAANVLEEFFETLDKDEKWNIRV